MADDVQTVILTDEDGNDLPFEVLAVLGMEQGEYAVLADPGSEDQAFVFRIEESNDGEVFVTIDNDQEYQAVVDEWQRMLEEEEQGED